MEAWDAAAVLPLATLPAWAEQQGLAERPTLIAGGEPRAAVILVEIEARAAGGADA